MTRAVAPMRSASRSQTRSRRATAGKLGARLRAADPNVAENDILVTLAAGKPADREQLEFTLGSEFVAELVTTRILQDWCGTVQLPHALGLAHDVIYAAPDDSPDAGGATRPDALYLGPDSALLTEAALRLAPCGHRAADIGTGTGLLAAILARHYDTVIATDRLPRAAAAARLTLDLNGGDRSTGVLVTDVAAALRPRSFDLVTANPPWVPTPDQVGAPRRVFADGGPTGTELPCRFILQAAALLCPGGVAVVLALDVTCDDGRQPIRDVCTKLANAGYITAVVPTRLRHLVPELESKMRERQPSLLAAHHVAVVLGAPTAHRTFRHDLHVATEHLARRWAIDDRSFGPRTRTGPEPGQERGTDG